MSAVEPDVRLDRQELRRRLEDDVRRGLLASPKWTSPVWFYDERGGRLFDEITRLPEYYPTRAERSILETGAAEIATIAGCDTLVELGSGTSEKTRLLLDALSDEGVLRHFVPVDVDVETLRSSSQAISSAYPALGVHPVVADFNDLSDLPHPGKRRLVAFLGSTIGNFVPAARARFLFDLGAALSHDEFVLLGVDLVKDEGRLVAAYDDAAGVTAEFNRNVLRVLNNELGANFDLGAFEHVAMWDREHEWIEMRLRSVRNQQVRLDALDLEVEFVEAEDLRTEISAKFTEERVRGELWKAGFVIDKTWTDAAQDFLLVLASPTADGPRRDGVTAVL